MLKPLSLLAVLVLSAGSPLNLCLATDYFVSGTGDDAKAGTSAAEAFRTLTRAMMAAGPGDRVVVLAGTYDAGAGESFPIPVGNGVSIEGPADSTAVVDSTFSGGAAFTVGALADPTTIRGLTIQSSLSTGVGILCTGLPAALVVASNEMTGRDGLNNTPGGAVQAGGSSVLEVTGNTIATQHLGIRWAARSVSAAHQVTLSGNTIAGGSIPVRLSATQTAAGMAELVAAVTGNTIQASNGTEDVIVARAGAAAGRASLEATITGNTVSTGHDGIRVLATGSGSGSASVSGTVASNAVSNTAGAGLATLAEAIDAATVSYQVDLIANTVTLGSETGAVVRVRAAGNGTVTSASRIACNSVTSQSGNGLSLSIVAENAGVVSANPTLEYNALSNNVADGFTGRVAAGGTAALSGILTVMGNTVAGNGGDGVALRATEVGSPTISFGADFGGFAPATPGRNTFAGNGGYDFNVSGIQDSSGTLPAEGNWWGADSESGIAAGIYDRMDDPGVLAVDHDPFLLDPLSFTAGALAPGGVGVATAAPGSAFVEKAGRGTIEVEIGGMAAGAPAVDASGGTVQFTIPGVLVAGQYTLTITNPGGQSGTLQITLGAGGGGGGGGGGCFVATAAYGDPEAPEIGVLRRWRDECLAGSSAGRGLVRAYYALSPRLAGAVASSPAARAVSRAALAPVVGAVRLWLELPGLYGLAAALWLVRRLRRIR